MPCMPARSEAAGTGRYQPAKYRKPGSLGTKLPEDELDSRRDLFQGWIQKKLPHWRAGSLSAAASTEENYSLESYPVMEGLDFWPLSTVLFTASITYSSPACADGALSSGTSTMPYNWQEYFRLPTETESRAETQMEAAGIISINMV